MNLVWAAAPRGSIVIVCYGNREITERCLESLERSLGPRLGSEIELVLVDNASPDSTLEVLEQWRDRATVLALPENRNFAGGCNAGAAASRGDVLVFLNNDTIVGPDTLEPLVETALEPGVGAAGLRLVYPDGTIQHAGVLMLPNPGFGDLCSPFHVLKHEDGDTPAARAEYELDAVTAACVAVRRTVFEGVGGFDEGYRNGFEDIDLCLRIRSGGHTIVYRGDLAIVHDESVTRGTDESQDLPNVHRLLGTWGSLLEPDTELADAVWGADLGSRYHVRSEASTPITLVGHPSSIGPAADEARALLLALECAGAPAVAIDLGQYLIRPRLEAPLGDALTRAQRREVADSYVVIAVPDGPATAARAHSWMRVPTAGGEKTLSATPNGDAWIPPAILAPVAPGPGGKGIAVSLPAHDERRTIEILESLAGAVDRPITVVPTMRTRGLTHLLDRMLPGCIVAGPFTAEEDWTRLSAVMDIAVCLDVDDAFERRALAAAAAGATPIVPRADGPAAAVLGTDAHVATPQTLAAAIAAAVSTAPARRAAVAARVRETCDPAAVGQAVLMALAGEAVAGR